LRLSQKVLARFWMNEWLDCKLVTINDVPVEALVPARRYLPIRGASQAMTIL
jgi:hypothetical protein